MDDIRLYILEALKPKKVKYDRISRRERHLKYKRERLKRLRKLKIWKRSPSGKKSLRKMKIRMSRPGYKGKTYY